MDVLIHTPSSGAFCSSDERPNSTQWAVRAGIDLDKTCPAQNGQTHPGARGAVGAGGVPGAMNLGASESLRAIIQRHHAAGGLLGVSSVVWSGITEGGETITKTAGDFFKEIFFGEFSNILKTFFIDDISL